MLRLKKQALKRDVLGFKLPMQRHEEETLDVSDILVIDPDNTYYMKMGTDAMDAYRIFKGNILVIDSSLEPVDDAIVVFSYHGEFYTRLYKKGKKKLLLKAGADAENIEIDVAEGWICFGVVLASINSLIHPKQKVGKYINVCSC